MKGEKGTITVDTIKDRTGNTMPDFKYIDVMHIYQTILSRELPPERYGAIINLELANRQSATIEEVEDSLVRNRKYSNKFNIHLLFQNVEFFQRYLYDTGPYVKIANLPPLRKLTSEKIKLNFFADNHFI